MYAHCAALLLASFLLGAVSAATHQYSVKEDNKKCLIADIDANIIVSYKDKHGKTETAHIELLPEDAAGVRVEGDCATTPADKQATLIITFNSTTLTVNFTKTDKGDVTLSAVEYDYQQDSSLFPNTSGEGPAAAIKTGDLLTMGNDKQYFQCHSSIKLEINPDVSMDFVSMKVQAFNVMDDFSPDAAICSQDEATTSTLKPTTEAPTTHPTTPAPTTHPTMPPTPHGGNWTVTASNGSVCIVAHMAVRFNITYLTKQTKNATAVIDLPADATSNGDCGNDTQTLILTFHKDWELEMSFTLEGATASATTKTEYSVHNVSLTYYHTAALFPDAEVDPTEKMVAHADGLDLFRVGREMSFRCNSKQEQELNADVKLDTYDLQIQAFKYDNGTKFFGGALECPADSVTNSVVPIAVGVALAVLVALVLIAYIIGRKRSRTGYDSV